MQDRVVFLELALELPVIEATARIFESAKRLLQRSKIEDGLKRGVLRRLLQGQNRQPRRCPSNMRYCVLYFITK